MRTTITLNEVADPAFDLTGAHDGPHLSLIAACTAAVDYNGLTLGLGTDFAVD